MSLIGIIFAKADWRDFKSEVRSQLESQARKTDDVMAAGHKDALEIMRQMTVLHERVAVVEAKQGRWAGYLKGVEYPHSVCLRIVL